MVGLLCWSFVAQAQAQEASDRDGVPPGILKFERFDEASQTVHLLQTVEALVPIIFKEVTADGATVDKVAHSIQSVETVQALSSKDMRLFTVKGDPLKVAPTLAKLKKGDPVLTVTAGKLVPKAFRPLFKEDVIVIELPPVMPPPTPPMK
jgi:hypothetical protein